MQTKGNSWTDVIEKSSLSSGTTWCRCSIDGIRSDSLIPMLTFPLCYLPSQAGSPFRVVSSRFTFGHLSNPSGAGSFPFSVVPAEVPGLALIGSPRANRWIGVVFSLARPESPACFWSWGMRGRHPNHMIAESGDEWLEDDYHVTTTRKSSVLCKQHPHQPDN